MDELQGVNQAMSAVIGVLGQMAKVMEKRAEVSIFVDDYGQEHYSYRGVVWHADWINGCLARVTRVMRDPAIFALMIDHDGSPEMMMRDPIFRFLAGWPLDQNDEGGE